MWQTAMHTFTLLRVVMDNCDDNKNRTGDLIIKHVTEETRISLKSAGRRSQLRGLPDCRNSNSSAGSPQGVMEQAAS